MNESTLGLSVSDVVNVSISLTPGGGVARNFGATLALGGSGVIDVVQRLRSYISITEVGLDFANNDPEFLAAESFFIQSPQPQFLYIGAWAKTATPAILHGAILTPTQQLLSNFTGITNGSMSISFNSTAHPLTGLNFSSCSNINAVAAVIQTAFATGGLAATVVWNASYERFDVTGVTTGSSATISYATATGSGTDVSALLGLTQTGGSSTVAGAAAESPLSAVQALASISNDWYMGGIADTSVTDVQHEAVATYIEALAPSRVYGITTQETAALNPTSTSDLPYLLQQSGFTRTCSQYSSSNPYAIFSFFGRNATINYANGNNVAITMKFQSEPGTTPELLTETQAAALNAKNCNVFVTYQNGLSIVQQGVMASGLFFDVRQGVDWLQNQAQSDLFNAFVQAGSKIPQTDQGMNVLTTTLAGTLARGVNNGLIAPGTWNTAGFGALSEGQYLSSGYYIYTPPMSSQSEATRVTRVAPLMQAAVKWAGAIHFADVAISVNQ
jgi:hypothetical protein